MDRRTKYRHLLWWIICLDLLTVIWLGYRYLDRKIPDELYVTESQEQQVKNVLDYPLLSFDDAITVSGDGSYLLSSRILGVIPFKDVKVIPTDSTTVLVSGSTVGIYMETDGVLVIDTGEIISEEGRAEEPAEKIIEPGDYIVAFNDEIIETKKDLVEDLEKLKQEQKKEIEAMRNRLLMLFVQELRTPLSLIIAPLKELQKDDSQTSQLSLRVRDNTQGIGTLTFVDQNGNYGALGHGISDVDTGELLHIDDGDLYQAQIVGIQKGSSGSPGELSGLIHYEAEKIIGSIEKNCEQGIYGKLSELPEELGLRKMEVAYKQELEIGPASILCCVDGTVREFDAEITRIDMNHEDTNKSFVIQVTDPELLELTGGIVQGMSGSPVIQNGKFVGAVTHVFIQDSTGGYGIFAENMLENI